MNRGLKVLSFNCWGLPFITPHKNRRLDAIADTIRKGGWDIVALQEVWLKSDQMRLVQKCRYPYYYIFQGTSKLLGPGIVILSKHKILKTDFYQFRVTGFPHHIREGDFHAAKGVGFALVETPIGEVPVFVTHLIAKYSRRHEVDFNRLFRLAQILELVFFVRSQATPSGFVLCGDLNAEEKDLEIQALCALSGLSQSRPVRLKSDKPRLDHIICGATFDKLDLKTSSPQLVFRKTFSGERIPFSDHHGVSAIVRRQNVQVHSAETKKILERTLRYMRFSINHVKSILRFFSYIPVLGWLIQWLLRPQLTHVDFLLDLLQTDVKQVQSKHPLRLSVG